MNPTALAIDGRLSTPAAELLFFPRIFRQLYFMVVLASYKFECPGATSRERGLISKSIFAMLSRCSHSSVVLLFLFHCELSYEDIFRPAG
jgi:hypothetical protein